MIKKLLSYFIKRIKNLLGSILMKLADLIDPSTQLNDEDEITNPIHDPESIELDRLNKINEAISFKFGRHQGCAGMAEHFTTSLKFS